jgi:hypothetical protein
MEISTFFNVCSNTDDNFYLRLLSLQVENINTICVKNPLKRSRFPRILKKVPKYGCSIYCWLQFSFLNKYKNLEEFNILLKTSSAWLLGTKYKQINFKKYTIRYLPSKQRNMHSRCFGIMGGHGNVAFNLAVKLSVELSFVFLSLRL